MNHYFRFYEKWGCCGVLGVIDGTYVEIISPPVTDDNHPLFVYINRKGKHSINVMLVLVHIFMILLVILAI